MRLATSQLPDQSELGDEHHDEVEIPAARRKTHDGETLHYCLGQTGGDQHGGHGTVRLDVSRLHEDRQISHELRLLFDLLLFDR